MPGEPMKLVAINAGLPREVAWHGKTVLTSIWKEPVNGPVRVSTLNIEGDRQADLSVHGGADKAVYVYPSEHYDYWRGELPGTDLAWGAFGENFTSEGLAEDEVRIGDRLGIGSAEFSVTQPRMPCFKLGIRFGRPAIVRQFLRSGRAGFYLAVTREGETSAGDPIRILERKGNSLTVSEIVRLYAADSANQDLLHRAAGLAGLPESWREYFRKRLWEPDV
jgi:MOSC domain-containing protein YiiM